MSTPLKPCPFCGQTDIRVSRYGEVFCMSGDCGARMSPDDCDPIPAWNRRASDAEGLRLRRMLKELRATVSLYPDGGAHILDRTIPDLLNGTRPTYMERLCDSIDAAMRGEEGS